MSSPSQQFLDYNIPIPYVKFLNNLRGTANTQKSSRYWLSNPRRMDDSTWEVLTVSFRSPVSISQISFDLLEIGQQWEFWYYDTQGRRLPVLDESLRQFSGSIGTGDVSKWYSFLNTIYVFVCTKIEFRIKRVADQYLQPSASYSLGVRNLLFKRNIYSREDAITPLGNEVDPIGNLVENFVKDWDAPKAIDGQPTTFWKCSPQPDPNAVVCFYLDCRDANGNAQRIDRMYMNPVYSGQPLNLYYSIDDTVGQRRLNTTFVLPKVDTNAPQLNGIGLDLTATTADYEFDSTVLGIQPGKSIWFGALWSPNFASNSPPTNDLTIFQDIGGNVHIKYRYATNSFEVQWGAAVNTFNMGRFTAGAMISFAFRVIYPNDPSGMAAGFYFDAVNDSGTVLATGFVAATPATLSLTGENFKFAYASGYLAMFFIKQEGATNGKIYSAFQNIEAFTFIDTINPDNTINMIYGANFTQDEAGYGGLDNEFFSQKVWSPIWVNWTAEKGFYYFPQPILAKFLKLEFSGLTEEQYPIYETGIQVEYQTFPINVVQTSVSQVNSTSDTVTNTATSNSSQKGLLYNNYYSSSKYNQSVTQFPQDIQITIGQGSELTTTPQMYDTPISTTVSQETSSSTYYRSSSSTNVQDISSAKYYTVVSGDTLIGIGQKFGINWHDIYSANQQEIAGDPRVGLLPHRSAGWWIFPGQVLRIPGAIMNQITTTSTNTEKVVNSSTTTTTRTRFSTTQVHRYDVRTVTRDAAIAYFAGINEIQVFTVNYAALYDNDDYIIPTYDSTFTMTNMQAFSTGAWERLVSTSIGQIVSAEWDSMSFFQRLAFTPYDRGLYQQINGTQLTAIPSAGQASASYWDDVNAYWNDPTVLWENPASILAVTFQSGQYFSGKQAAAVYRPAGAGNAGIQNSMSFALDANARVRVVTDFFLPDPTITNPIVVQIYDVTSATVLAQYNLPVNKFNQWVNFTSPFYVNTTARTNVILRFLIEGSQAETMYVADLYPQTTTVLYEASNDGGVNYFDITSVAYNPGTYFMFPTLNRKLKFRVTLYDPGDFVYGFHATPTYIRY